MSTHDLTTEEVRARYNAQAEVYQTRYVGLKGDYYRRFEDAIFLEFLQVDGKRVLDLGTGRGRLALLLADRAREIVGLDISDEMIRLATEASGERKNVHFERGDAADLRFADASFDCVSSVGMFPYVRDVYPYFAEINRVLVRDGMFAFSIANADEWHFGARIEHGVRELARRALRREPSSPPPPSPLIPHRIHELEPELARAGFELVDVRTTFFYVPSRMFYVAGRRALRPLQDLAVSANRLLGRNPITRTHGKVAVLCARKVGSAQTA